MHQQICSRHAAGPYWILPDGPAALRDAHSSCAECVLRWKVKQLIVCLRQGYAFATTTMPGDRSISSPVEALLAYFTQGEHLILLPEMTNAMERPLMEVCIVRRMVGDSRFFASAPNSRNEASVVISRSSIHGCGCPQSWCLCSRRNS